MFPGAAIHSPNSAESTEGISPEEAAAGAATAATAAFLEEGQTLTRVYNVK